MLRDNVKSLEEQVSVRELQTIKLLQLGKHYKSFFYVKLIGSIVNWILDFSMSSAII